MELAPRAGENIPESFQERSDHLFAASLDNRGIGDPDQLFN